MQTKIRKRADSAAVIIPATGLAVAGMSIGDAVDLLACEGQITLRKSSPKYDLVDLLQTSPEGSFDITDEDRRWLDDCSIGKCHAF